MTRILADLQTFPEFFKYLQAFGAKDFAKDEGFSGYDIASSRNMDDTLECVGMLASNNTRSIRL